MEKKGMKFDTVSPPLLDVLKSVRAGNIQLPEFQRDWRWDNDHVKSLLASVSLSYPIGAVMLLQTGSQTVRFEPRLMKGVPEIIPPVEPEYFILDGQQRLTALFQSLMLQGPVKTRDSKGNDIRCWYYVDMERALDSNGDREEAIIDIPYNEDLPEEKIKRTDFQRTVVLVSSTREKEWKARHFPLSLVFDANAWMAWIFGFQSHEGPDHVSRLKDIAERLHEAVIWPFNNYHLPVIRLFKENPKEAVCQVFEKVNTGGVPLTVFELLTATFAADNYKLRDDWDKRVKQLREPKVLRGTTEGDFLQAVTLLATRNRQNQARQRGEPNERIPGISCKRKEVLELSLTEYVDLADSVTKGFIDAAKFLEEQHVFFSADLPYRTQLIPLAAILAALGARSEDYGVRAKLSRWFWSGVFGELYGGAIESRFAKDLPQVLVWADGAEEPDTVRDANFVPSRLLKLRTRNSAAYKGLYALLLQNGCRDFQSGSQIKIKASFRDKIDIHHIFPKAWCKANLVKPKNYDCVVNKTVIGSAANRSIGGRAPSVYLSTLANKWKISEDISEEQMDWFLVTHCIEPGFMRTNDFWGFFAARQEALLSLIEKAMGKPVRRDVPEEEADLTEYKEEDEDGEEDEAEEGF